MTLRRPAAAALAVFLVVAAPARPEESRAAPAWRIRSLSANVDLRPGTSALSVTAEILLAPSGAGIPAPEVALHPDSRTNASSPETIGFFLNRGLTVKEMNVDGEPVRWSLDNDLDRTPFAPDARRITVPVRVPDSADAGGPGVEAGDVRLWITYEGSIPSKPDSPARLTPALAELNLYAAWLPIVEGPQGFPYDLTVKVPHGYIVVGNAIGGASGDPSIMAFIPEGKGEGVQGEYPVPPRPADVVLEGADGGEPTSSHRFKGWSAAGDVPLIAARGLTSLPVQNEGRCHVEIYVTDLPERRKQEVAEETAWACEFLSARSGDARTLLRVVVVPRQEDGYARPPLVVVPAGWFTQEGIDAPPISGGEDEWRRRLYHEIAHVFAPLADTHTSDDWINEGFAEHLAIRALGARRGEEAAARYLRRYLLDLAERPPSPPIPPPERVVAARPPGVSPTEGAGEPADETAGGSRDTARQETSPEEAPEVEGAAGGRIARLSTEELAIARVRLAPISATRRGDPDAPLLYYRKGALIFRMLDGMLSSDRWEETLASLRAAYPASSSARMTSADLVTALERSSGRRFEWLRRDWIDGSGLPALRADVRVVKWYGAQVRFAVVGEIVQTSQRPFGLLVPLVARGGRDEETTWVEIEGARGEVRWILPFKPEEVLLDPGRVIPRIDATVTEALRLRGIEARSWSFAQEGLSAERDGSFSVAMRSYERAAAADPSSAFPWYRRGRVLMALNEPEAALRAHRRAASLADREARSSLRIEMSRRPESSPMDAPPASWLDPPPDLRSWNWIRIGQIFDVRGERRAAMRAYENALRAPDLRGAHDEARHYLDVPFTAASLVPTPRKDPDVH